VCCCGALLQCVVAVCCSSVLLQGVYLPIFCVIHQSRKRRIKTTEHPLVDRKKKVSCIVVLFSTYSSGLTFENFCLPEILSIPRSTHWYTEILKSQVTAICIKHNNYTADFWEFLWTAGSTPRSTHCGTKTLKSQLATPLWILSRRMTRQTGIENTINSYHKITEILESQLATGWRRLIGYLQLQVIFRKRATNYRALLRKMTYEDKAS